MSRVSQTVVAATFVLLGASNTAPLQAGTIVMTEEGRLLHAQSLLIDGHNDLPWMMREAGDIGLTRFDLTKPQTRFNTDIPRLRRGGMGAQFWSAYVPCSTANDGTAYRTMREQVDMIRRMMTKWPNDFELALTPDDVQRIRATGKIAGIVALEGGHGIESSLEKLRELHAMGARYLTLTHSESTAWADSATGRVISGGLSDFGREVIREMNRLGMLVDISHVSFDTMRDVLETSTAPIIASHSSAYAIRQHVRNVPDDLLRVIGDKGGVVMVNFYPSYIVPDGSSARADVDTVVDHIDHIAKVAGVDHVGLGSDFDGVPSLPRQLEDVSGYPYITQALLNRGYTAPDIRKILGENVLRAWSDALRAAH